MLRRWQDLPDFMKIPEVQPYWEVLNKKRGQLILKRIFDLVIGLILLVIFLIAIINICTKSNLRKGAIILAPSLRSQPTMVGKAWQQEHEASCHITSAVRDLSPSHSA